MGLIRFDGHPEAGIRHQKNIHNEEDAKNCGEVEQQFAD
jgi:hypothetical protein